MCGRSWIISTIVLGLVAGRGALGGELHDDGKIGVGLTVEVSAGKHDRLGTPVSLTLTESLKSHHCFTLTREESGQSVPVQVTGGERGQLVWLLSDPLAAGTTRRYRLTPTSESTRLNQVVNVENDDSRMTVTVSGKPVLVYNIAAVRSSNREEAYYDRSGYIHPLYNPRGQIITDDFAPDHPHQHGIMFPWTNTIFEGRAINFWDQKGGTAKIEHSSIELREMGPVFGGFTVRLQHLDLTTTGQPQVVLTETWQVRVYSLMDRYLFDLDSVQRCAGTSLQIEENSYGGLAIRGHRNWLTPGQGDFLTSGGKTRQNGNHTRVRWCDIHGKIAGQMTGVTIFCRPDNFRAPQPVRLHPVKPYFCFAPMVLGKFEIEPDKPYVSSYRFDVHDGRRDPQMAERIWQDLADPPVVKLSGNAIEKQH